MVTAAAYPFAFTLTALLAASAAYRETGLSRRREFAVPIWAIWAFAVGLGGASLAFGILNPEAIELVGLEGIVSP